MVEEEEEVVGVAVAEGVALGVAATVGVGAELLPKGARVVVATWKLLTPSPLVMPAELSLAKVYSGWPL